MGRQTERPESCNRKATPESKEEVSKTGRRETRFAMSGWKVMVRTFDNATSNPSRAKPGRQDRTERARKIPAGGRLYGGDVSVSLALPKETSEVREKCQGSCGDRYRQPSRFPGGHQGRRGLATGASMSIPDGSCCELMGACEDRRFTVI